MGRIVKDFSIETGGGSGSDRGLVDSGASCTTLKSSLARSLGFDPKSAGKTAAAESASDDTLVGYWLPVCLKVDKREACVKAFVPIGKMKGDGSEEPFEIDENLIGADFLQASRAMLDYSKPDDRAFSGLSKRLPKLGGGLLRFRDATAAEKRALSRLGRRKMRGR